MEMKKRKNSELNNILKILLENSKGKINDTETFLLLKNILTSQTKDTRKYKKSQEKCLDKNLIAGYYDNTLSLKLKEKVEKHLLNCDYCLYELIELHYTINKLKNTTLKKIPKNIKQILNQFLLKKKINLFISIKDELNKISIIDTNIHHIKISPKPIILRGKLKKQNKTTKIIIPINKGIHIKSLTIKKFSKSKFEFYLRPDNIAKYKILLKIYRNGKLIKKDYISHDNNINTFKYILNKSPSYNFILIENKIKYNITLKIK